MLLFLVLSGCVSGAVDPDDSEGWSPGTFHVVRFAFAGAEDRLEPSVVQGFDLDGRASSRDDPEGCFNEDFTWPPESSVQNIDNQLGWLMSGMGPWFFVGEIDANTAYEHAIQGGDLRFDVITRGEDAVQVGVTIDEVGYDADIHTIDANRRTANLTSAIEIPIHSAIGAYPLTVNDAQIEMTARGDSISGFLGGTVSVDDVLAILEPMIMPEDWPVVSTTVSNNADLQPDAEHVCAAISVAWSFEGSRTASR